MTRIDLESSVDAIILSVYQKKKSRAFVWLSSWGRAGTLEDEKKGPQALEHDPDAPKPLDSMQKAPETIRRCMEDQNDPAVSLRSQEIEEKCISNVKIAFFRFLDYFSISGLSGKDLGLRNGSFGLGNNRVESLYFHFILISFIFPLGIG